MKADTQYNDFVGTAAANISDYKNLKEFLHSKNIDTERFHPIGARFYHGYSNFFSGTFICTDKQKSTEDKKHIVDLQFEEALSHKDFFNLFKRFEVIITEKHGGYEDKPIDEEITNENNNEDY
jgi:hypothetical protein